MGLRTLPNLEDLTSNLKAMAPDEQTPRSKVLGMGSVAGHSLAHCRRTAMEGLRAMHAALPLPCADALAQDLAGKPLLSLGMHQSSDAPKSLLNQEVALQSLQALGKHESS